MVAAILDYVRSARFTAGIYVCSFYSHTQSMSIKTGKEALNVYYLLFCALKTNKSPGTRFVGFIFFVKI